MKRIVLVALVLGGCSSVTEPEASTSLASPNAVGSYNLVTVNAEGLPAAVSVGGAQFTVTSALMDIRSGNTFSGSVSARNVATGMGMTKDFAGTWTQSGDSLTLLYDSGDCSDLAVIAGPTLRIAADCAHGFELLYHR